MPPPPLLSLLGWPFFDYIKRAAGARGWRSLYYSIPGKREEEEEGDQSLGTRRHLFQKYAGGWREGKAGLSYSLGRVGRGGRKGLCKEGSRARAP